MQCNIIYYKRHRISKFRTSSFIGIVGWKMHNCPISTALGIYIMKSSWLFIISLLRSFLFLKTNNCYHNIAPKGALFKLQRSVIMVELFIYAIQSSVRSEIIINTKVKTTSLYKLKSLLFLFIFFNFIIRQPNPPAGGTLRRSFWIFY